MNEHGGAGGRVGGSGRDERERAKALLAAAESEAAEIRHAAEEDAQARRREAEAAALHYLNEAKKRSETLVLERVRRIAELSDEIVRRSESLIDDLDETGEVKQRLDELVHALGTTANRVAREASRARAASVEPMEPLDGDGPTAHAPGSERPPEDAPLAAAEGAAVAEEASEDPGSAGLARRIFRRWLAIEPPEPGPAQAGAGAEPAGVEQPPGNAVAVSEQLEPELRTPFEGARLLAFRMALAGRTREEVGIALRRGFDLDDPEALLDDVFGAPPRRSRSHRFVRGEPDDLEA